MTGRLNSQGGYFKKGALPPFAYLKHLPLRNPIVPLPEDASQILDKVTHCLITHSQKWGIELLRCKALYHPLQISCYFPVHFKLLGGL